QIVINLFFNQNVKKGIETIAKEKSELSSIRTVINLVSSNESETDSLVSSYYNTQEDDYFQDNDDNNRVNLVIKRLLAVSATKATVESLSILKFFSSTSYENKNDNNNESMIEQSENDNENDNNEDNNNENMTEKKKIANAIEFVSKVIREKKLLETEKAHYIATLYFLCSQSVLGNGRIFV
ncbi:10185_t:CDS:2, partial [Gigaspora margarita]